MYGGRFKQHFGWYIEQAAYRLGIAPNRTYLGDVCPEELWHLIEDGQEASERAESERLRLVSIAYGPERSDIPPDEITYWHNVRLDDAKPYQALARAASQLSRRLSNYFEDLVRGEFGARRIGEAHVCESLLYAIIRRLLPDDEVIRHCRPDWLEGLELDVFLPTRKLAIEYQGQQHFHPVKAWGGRSALEQLHERDAKKRRLCVERGITLVEFDYSEPLTESHVRERISISAAPSS